MKSFDMDGDSVLNYEEFKAGIAKTTGQNAPDPIIRAVFGMLDKDRDGAITTARSCSSSARRTQA